MEKILELLFGLIALSVFFTIFSIRIAILVAIALSAIYAVLAFIHEQNIKKQEKNKIFSKRRGV